jgi:hypothetical protein
LHNVAVAILFSVVLSFALLFSCISSAFQPLYAQEEIRLEAVTDQGTFKVELIWTPDDIGKANTFEIHFVDPDTGIEIEDIKYDFSIYRDDNNSPEIQRLDQVSTFQEVFFEEAGSYELRVDDIEDLGEQVIVPIQVTPEFHPKVVFTLFIAALAIAMIAPRVNRNNLFRRTINHSAMTRSIFFLIALLVGAICSVTSATIASAAYAQEGGMIKPTDKGTLDIGLTPTWSDGGQAMFTVSFLNPGTETLHQHQDYDFRILKDGQEVFSAARQTGQAVLHNVEGTLTVPYTFPENGDYTVQVYLAGTGIPAIPTDEEATFPITVTPEFPAAGILPAVLAASLITGIVLSQRMKLI